MPLKTAPTSVKIAPRKKRALERIAKAEDRTLSEHLRWLIDRNLDEHKEPA